MSKKHITEGIDFLTTQQREDGSFISLSSPDPRNFHTAHASRANFPTILILQCLCEMNSTPQLETLKKHCATFLLTQKSNYWTFNYWTRNSQEAQTMPYPDDLDDTFCALAALYRYNQTLIDGSVLATVIQLLTTLESQEGGPYYTWLVSEKAEINWRDIDLVVNSNIAYFLSLQKVSLPKITDLIETAIDQNNLRSLYYPSLYPIIYFISRFYRRQRKKKLINILLSQKSNGIWENPLSTALSVSALLNFGVAPSRLEKSIRYLLEKQKNGHWNPYPLYPDPLMHGKLFYAGSAALTTAFCLEALEKFAKTKTETVTVVQSQKDKEEQELYRQIIATVEKRFETLEPGNKQTALSELHAVLKGNNAKQIPLLPYYFVSSLGKLQNKIPKELIIQTGVANVFGWLAYTIYDDFFDGEADPKTLAIANIALRELTLIFNNRLNSISEFQSLFQEVMDRLEEANMWENSHCTIKITNNTIDFTNLRVPDYKHYEQLAQKSFGHLLGPLAILFYLGFKKESPESIAIISFFKHYLIARQMNDDAHDWEKDLIKGYVNPVGAKLLQTHRLYASKEQIKMQILLPELKEMLWHRLIREICQIIEDNIQSARVNLHTTSLIDDYLPFEMLLSPLEQAAKKTLKERGEMIKFLKKYR